LEKFSSFQLQDGSEPTSILDKKEPYFWDISYGMVTQEFQLFEPTKGTVLLLNFAGLFKGYNILGNLG